MHYDAFDDLTVLSNDLTDAPGLTLCGLVRNEMYFLPAFLDHYRRLGVQRFILLDDRSDDGTREHLAAQPDVMTLGSGYRYGARNAATTGPLAGKALTMGHIWKTLLMQRYCTGRWGLCLDVDEFIILPPGQTLRDLVERIPAGSAPAITGVMLDAYPASVEEMKSTAPFNPAGDWFVDGRQHVAYSRRRGDFRIVYAGSRARLMERHGLENGSRLKNMVKRIVQPLMGQSRLPRFNELPKIVLMKWETGAAFLNGHRTTQEVDPDILLPVLHFKFTPDLYRRIQTALAEGQYHNASREYRLMHELLTRMEAAGGAFLQEGSHKAADFEALHRAGNARLP